MNPLTILIGDSDDVITEFLTHLVQCAAGTECELEVWSSMYADELRAIAEVQRIDLSLLFLNNILHDTLPATTDQRVKQAQTLISKIKHATGSPVITLGAMPVYAGNAEAAGAECYFRIPFKADALVEVLESCLSETVA
ncbi:MAG: hypothetical protein KKA42_03050 [candidate division Zixibacteria bacterium]|nr:hypothetical protein [candidate division Zixibacteria bacterium]